MNDLFARLDPLFAQLHSLQPAFLRPVFLRPWWLLAILPALALAVALWRQPSSGANWRRAIAADLLGHLLTPQFELRQRWPWLALLGWIIAAVAMAGPAWEKMPQPVLQKRDGLVIVLDLSLSMYAEDVQPSRLQRARFKILDMLQRRSEGLTGLVAYSGDAHVVSPLTDDTATIANLVPALAPDMMPIYGSDPVAGIEQAIQLLHNAGFERGRIVLISDEISDANIDAIAGLIDAGHWQLSMLGVGTEQGAPIPIAANKQDGDNGGGFLKQRDGSIVVAQLHRPRFEQLARATNGRYSDLRVDDKDLDALLPTTLPTQNETRSVQREFDSWRERGPWLVILLLPIAASSFRRGWLLTFLLAAPLWTAPLASQSWAQELNKSGDAARVSHWNQTWRNLWQRPDQQGQRAFDSGDVKAAAEKFRDPAWKSAALYRAGDYQGAAQILQNSASADADYNRGNALAHAGELQQAIEAYDAALAKNPHMADASANRELVKKLLQQQKQQQQNQGKNNSGNDKQSEQKNNQAASSQQSQSDSSPQQNSSQGNQPQQNQSQGNQSASNQSSDNRAQTNDKANGDNASDEKKSQSNHNTDNAHDDKNNNDKNSPEDKSLMGSNTRQRNDKQPHSADQSQQATRQSGAEKQNDDNGKAAQQAAIDQQSKEQQQQQQRERATEQWLRQIPDDPAGLLRRKFLYEHRQRERSAPRDGQQPLW